MNCSAESVSPRRFAGTKLREAGVCWWDWGARWAGREVTFTV